MSNILGLRGGSRLCRIAPRSLYQSYRWFHFSRPLFSSLMNNTNDILVNATASMRRNKVIDKPQISKNQPEKGANQRKRLVKGYSSGYQTKKRLTINWTTGSERAQNAANHTLKQILKLNDRGVIKVVNQETNKLEETTVMIWASEIDLEHFGFLVVNVEQRGSHNIPLVKLVDSKTALKKYSDELAKLKEQELMKMGFSHRKLGKKNEKDSADDNLKQIKVSWQISDSDLNKQKANEITSQLKKGYKVYLYLNGKDALNKANWADDITSSAEVLESKFKSQKTTAKELKRRQQVLEQLIEIVSELALQPSIEGSTESKLIMKLSPKTSITKKENKTALKEERKRQRQAKVEMKVEKKRRNEAKSAF
ncbi:LADA_0E05424g1_1 [Lachancea dasiensis]|uniref:Altered inheritance of mitochondria protein 23, mitochondrial n=1 Tax=Lachancea dasiensis TaxID=1072105 RepID=A0A1G4JC43_9SACH|nr:LADA_0E05424g1_1 [Lachancea dasiensis]